MNAEKDKAPERPQRVWITWDDAYPWPTPEMGGDEYVHIDLLATARKEAFKEARHRVYMISGSTNVDPSVRKGFAAGVQAAIEVIAALERAAEGEPDNCSGCVPVRAGIRKRCSIHGLAATTDTDKTEKGVRDG